MEVKTYRVEGLSCIDCAGQIRSAVSRMNGVEQVEVDVATGDLKLWTVAPDFDITPVAEVVKATGHTLIVDPQRRRSTPSLLRFLISETSGVLTAIAAGLTVLGLALAVLGVPAPLGILPFVGAVLIGAWPVARHAYEEVFRARSLGINTLMVIAVTGAALIGEWSEAAVVVVLFALGESLEGYAAERARGALEGLLDLAPPLALRIDAAGAAEEIPVEQLALGDRVRIRAGDRISVDGIVQAGLSAVDQAPITGESVPVDKRVGDSVYAGTINTYGVLEVEVSRLAHDSTLSRMVALVREAQSRQAPVQRFIERFARIYTPSVTVAAALVAFLPPLVLQQPFWGAGGWFVRALEMLVIACPCALVISTPVAVVSALTQAAQQGVLVKGGRTLEALGQIEVFAFDKTGTLTTGHPVTTDVLDVCADDCSEGLRYAASVEAQSSHPLARALIDEAKARRLSLWPAEGVALLHGGISGSVNGANVMVASHPYFDTSVPHAEDICEEADRLAASGKTVMLVAHDGQVCSVFAVADALRPESRDAIAQLHALGRIRTLMLTGDALRVAQAIAEQAGIDELRAGLLPEDKVAVLRELVTAGTAVAMVGDGVNDAPALAQATVGIAMGGVGTDQAMETADVVLMGDDLHQLPFLIRLSRYTRRVIRFNIALALLIKATVLALAIAGVATLWMAIVADVGASMLVILNSMRLRSAGARHNHGKEPLREPALT